LATAVGIGLPIGNPLTAELLLGMPGRGQEELAAAGSFMERTIPTKEPTDFIAPDKALTAELTALAVVERGATAICTILSSCIISPEA